MRDLIKEAFYSRDWDALRAVAAPDFVYEDRGKRALVRGDVETWIGSVQFGAQPGFQVQNTSLGSVGERLALHQLVWSGEPGGDAFEFDRLRLLELDGQGRLIAITLFDTDDRAAAFGEMQTRFLAGEGAEIGGQAPTARIFAAFDAEDWDGLRAVLAPGVLYHDHRRLGFGVLETEAWIDSLRVQRELTSDLAIEEIGTLDCNRHGRVMKIRIRGANPEGGAFENLLVLVHRSEDDRILNHETFDPEDADRALARFEELCAGCEGLDS
jgi:ketosteroid isomerase-like protein